MRTRSLRLPASNDTRLLAAGVAAFVALVTYLVVAFATTHALAMPTAPGLPSSVASKVAPWTPSASELTPVRRKNGGFDVRVTPAGAGRATGGNYGAIVQTLVPDPAPGGRYEVGLWLKASPPGRIGVELNEFRPGVARYPVETTVLATPRWRHFTFGTRVRGTWLGLAVYVYRPNQRRRTSFAVRGVMATLRGR